MKPEVRNLFYVASTIALVIVVSSVVTFVSGTRVIQANEDLSRHYEVLRTLENTLAMMADAETGARGFLLARDESFLSPYVGALPKVQENLDTLDKWVARGQLSKADVTELKRLIQIKLERMRTGIDLTRSDPEAAIVRVKTGQGRLAMDEIRNYVARMRKVESLEVENSRHLVDELTRIRTGVFISCGAIELLFVFWAARRIKTGMDRVSASAQTIREQGELYATTLASIGDAVITTDDQGVVTFMNPIAVELTGWKPEEAIGQSLSKVFRIINESTRLPVENPADKVLRLGTIVGLANHTLLIRRDGVETPIDDSGAPIRHADGSIRGVVLVFRDFSDHKKTEAAIRQSEEQMRLAVEGADLGMFYCTYPLDKIIWNEQCKRHFFLPPDAEVDFDLFYSILHPDDREPTRLAIEKAQNNHVPYDIEYRTVAHDGRMRWIRAIGRFFYDAKDQPIRFDGITIDVSDKKAREQAIQEARGQAEAANRAKDQFLATLSHELRTPLTPVLATLGMWDKQPGPPPGFRDEVQMLKRNVELEARLIDDLLDLTRVVKGKLVVSLERVDVHELLEHVATVCHEDVQSKKIHLEMNLQARQHFVRADSGRLQQVLWNILRNAVKFSPRESRVQVTTGNDAAGRLEISISDHGIGMTPQTIQKLFKPFEQGDSEITRRFGGLGLGLAISKALIDVQGGTIKAYSEGLGKGSAFTITLPVLSEKDAMTAQPSKSTNGGASSKRLRILLAEDHVDTSRILKLVMTNWGHEVETAGTVSQAVELAKMDRFDVLISDIGLPDGTGLDLIRQVRVFSQVPAIALTGYGMDEDVTASRAAGFNAHLTKPTDLQQLQTSINQLADGK